MKKNDKMIDRQIREFVKAKNLEEYGVFSKQLYGMAEGLVKQARSEKEKQRVSYRRYIPAAIAVVLIAAYPVKAAVDYVTVRLAGVSEEEKEKLRDMVYENDKQENSLEEEAIRYSRELTDSERQLYDKLQKQYQKGEFPQGALTILEDGAAAAGDMICYDPAEHYMYLPEHELTREELLEIIDFYHKLDHSLQTSSETTAYKQDMSRKKSQVSGEAAAKDEAERLAAQYIKAMYQLPVKDMSCTLAMESGDYLLSFEKDGICISVRLQADSCGFQSISMEQDGFVYYGDGLSADEDMLREKGKQAERIAVQLLGEDAVVTEAYAQYKLNQEGQIPHGSVLYLFELENGDRLRMSYSVAEDTLWGAGIEKGGAGHKDMNVRDDEERVFLKLKG